MRVRKLKKKHDVYFFEVSMVKTFMFNCCFEKQMNGISSPQKIGEKRRQMKFFNI